MIVVVSTDEEISAALTKAVTDLGYVARITDDVAEALRLAPQAAGVIFDGIPTDLVGEPLSTAQAPVVVLSLFGNRPILVSERIVYPFTLGRLQEIVKGLESAERQVERKTA